jgi:hypothetical protein
MSKPKTEQQWLTTKFIATLIYCVQEQKCASDRKFRLFAAACGRRVWDKLTDPRSRAAIEAAEQFADKRIKAKKLGQARTDAWDAARHICGVAGYDFDWEARKVPTAFDRGRPTVFRYAVGAAGAAIEYAQGAAWMAESVSNVKELAANCHLFRDIFGNPFQPVTFDKAWRTDTAIVLAKQMYESRDFSAMPVLADALQDADCDNVDILSHCRGDGLHVRGCWVVDLVLGRK